MLTPSGAFNHQNTCNTSNNGFGCAQRILAEGAINY